MADAGTSKLEPANPSDLIGPLTSAAITGGGTLGFDVGKMIVEGEPGESPKPSTPSKPSAPTGSTTQGKPDRASLLAEAYRRNLLPPDQKAAYEEAQRRGLIGGQSQSLTVGDVTKAVGDVGSALVSQTADRDKLGGQVSDWVRQQMGESADVDYDSGSHSFFAKWLVARSDNPAEVHKVLEHLYGPGNYGQDKGGRWWVREDGKKVEVYGGGQGLETEAKKMGFGAFAYTPVLGGAAVGGALGVEAAGEFPPAAVFTGPLGAGAGAAMGKLVDELAKGLGNFYAKTPYRELQTLKSTFIWNAVWEGLPPSLKAVGGKAKDALRSFFGITDAGERMTRQIVLGGGKPPLKTSVPGLYGLQWHQEYRTKIMGDPKVPVNTTYIRGQMEQTIRDAGYSAEETDGMMTELMQKDSAHSTTETGMQITQIVGSHMESLKTEADAAISTAKAAVERDIKDIKDLGDQDPGDLGRDIAQTITDERSNFGKAMKRAYTHVTEMIGNHPIVPTSGLKGEVEQILDTLPENAQPPILKKIMDLPDTITFADAHSYRSELRRMASSGNLTPGLQEFNLRQAATAVDDAMTETGERLTKGGHENVAAALKQVDEAYRAGIAKFYDAQFNQWVRRARTGIFPDATTVARQIMRPGEEQRLQTLLGMMPLELRERIASADMRNILDVSQDSAGKFLQEVNRRKGMLDSLYGHNRAAALRRAAKELAALEGKLPENLSLDPGVAASALERQAALTKQLDKFVEENPIAALGVPKAADRAVAMITRPGRENVTEQAMNFLGPQSEEWKAIQKHALIDLLSRAIEQSASLEPTVVGDTMKAVLQRYTRKQLDMLFPNGLEGDLVVLADRANYLFPKGEGPDMAAAFAASGVKMGLPLTIPFYIHAKIWGWMADHAIWFHNLASIAKSGDVSEFKAFRRMLYRIATRSSMQGPGTGRFHHHARTVTQHDQQTAPAATP